MALKALQDRSVSSRSLLWRVSWPVYLHFLDRELLSSFGVYESLSPSSVLADLRLLLLNTYEPIYFSASLTFENKFARMLFEQMPLLFQKGHIQMAIRENCLHDFVLSKKEQYSHARTIYPFYFDDTWKNIVEAGPHFRHKQGDTGNILEMSIISELETCGVNSTAKRLGIKIDSDEAAKLLPYAIEVIKGRQGHAITKLLFEKAYQKLATPPGVRKCFDIKISEHYVNSYLASYDGTIVTGLSSGIEYFSYLCPTFPFHHIPLWRQINQRLGCLSLITGKFSDQEISIIREAPQFQKFVDEIRYFLSRLAESQESLATRADRSPDSAKLIEHLERSIRTNLITAARAPRGIDEYLRMVELTVSHLRSTGSELRQNNGHSRPIRTMRRTPGRTSKIGSIQLQVIGKQYISTDQVRKVEVHMGDNYTVGQAGAVGPGSSAENISFSQVWNQLQQSVNLPQLAEELSQLRRAMKQESEGPETDVAISDVAKAELAAKEGDGSTVIRHLKNAGKFALDVATKIGTSVAVKAIEGAIGMK
jgi:hypothetical protein